VTGRSIRTRLTAAYLVVLTAATVALAAGAWVLLRQSIIVAADATLETRVRGVAQFIDAAQRSLTPEDLLDEFGEFAQLTSGDTLLEVVDSDGTVFTRPSLAGWDQLRVGTSPLDAPIAAARVVNGQPYRAVSHVLTVLDHRYVVHVAVPLATAFTALRNFG